MALKRTDSSSMFDTLKNTSISENKPSKEEVEKQSKTTQKENKAEKKVEEKNEQPISTQKDVSDSFDFIIKKAVREKKSVRKQFVLTPTYANWLKNVAEKNNVSENQVIESLIKMAMKEI